MSINEISQMKKLNEQLKNDMEAARELITHSGFYNAFFEKLGDPLNEEKTKVEIFDMVNNQYKRVFNLPGGKYSSYKSFQVVNRRLNR